MKLTKGIAWTGLTAGLMTGVALAGGRTSLESAAPVDVLSADALASSGGQNLEAVLRALPGVAPNNPQPGAGGAQINLRGLPSRELVLVNGKRFGASIGQGYNEDPTLNGSDGSSFTDLRLLTGGTLETDSLGMAAALGLNMTHYYDRVDNDGDDRTTFDLNLSFAGVRAFSDSVVLESLARFHYGDHGTLGAGYVRPGLQWTEVLDWETRTSLSYRLDGAALGDAGLEFSTYYQSHGFLEEDSDERDVLYLTIGQEFRVNLDDQTSVFGVAEYGLGRWDRWDAYDSDICRVGGGVRTGDDSYSLDFLVGWEWYDYDDLDEKQDGFYAELNYTRALSNSLSLNLKANYGIQESFPNEGFTDYVDATGLLLGSRLQYQINERAEVGVTLAVLDLDSEFSDADLHRGQLGVDGHFQLNDTFTLNPGIIWTNNEDTPSGDDDATVFRLGVNATF